MFFSAEEGEQRPKRAPTGFQLFCRDQRAELCFQCPRMNSQDMTSLLSYRWRKLDQKIREEYRRAAKLFSQPPVESVIKPSGDMKQEGNKEYFPLLEPANGEITERSINVDTLELTKQLAFPPRPFVLDGHATQTSQ